MNSTHLVGTKGEELALSYAQSLGYKLYAQNVRLGRDEIDLILFDPHDQVLVFLEVKTRSQRDQDFSVELNLTPAKKRKLFRSARAWIDQHDYQGSYRIDVILVQEDHVLDHFMQIEEGVTTA